MTFVRSSDGEFLVKKLYIFLIEPAQMPLLLSIKALPTQDAVYFVKHSCRENFTLFFILQIQKIQVPAFKAYFPGGTMIALFLPNAAGKCQGG